MNFVKFLLAGFLDLLLHVFYFVILVQLATILEENLKLNVFSLVIDVDNLHRYPKGTAKVAFIDSQDAWKAISINKVSLRIGNQLKHMEIKLFKKNIHQCY